MQTTTTTRQPRDRSRRDDAKAATIARKRQRFAKRFAHNLANGEG